MALVSKIRQIGNSQGVILPQAVLDQMNWPANAEVELLVEGNRLVIVQSVRRYATTEEAKAAGDYVFTKRRRLMQRLSK